MGCFQLTVSGSGSASPATVSFPGAYKATDPGILINIHSSSPSFTLIFTAHLCAATLSGYTIPGPAVYGGGGSSSPKPSTSPATTAPSTTTGTVTKPSSTSTSPVATGSAVAQYGQCGGTNYQGSTTCAAGFKCVGVSVPYVSFISRGERWCLLLVQVLLPVPVSAHDHAEPAVLGIAYTYSVTVTNVTNSAARCAALCLATGLYGRLYICLHFTLPPLCAACCTEIQSYS
jgi:hypothetical protein